MSKTVSEFVAEIAERAAASDAKAAADFADIMAGRPFKKRPLTKAAMEAEPPPPTKKPRKPRAKRKSTKATS